MLVRRNTKRKEKLKSIKKSTVRRTARMMRKATRRHISKKTTDNRDCALGDATPANRTRTKVVSPRINRISGEKRSVKNALKTKLITIAMNMPNPSAGD